MLKGQVVELKETGDFLWSYDLFVYIKMSMKATSKLLSFLIVSVLIRGSQILHFSQLKYS